MNVDAVLIAGPTASGKSAAALALAERIDGTLINADSMQVYREPRILTARPSESDMRRAPHLLYGHVSVHDRYDVARFAIDAREALGAVRASGRVPIFVGGTGLYFGALTDGIPDMPRIPQAIREAARARREELGAEAFFDELACRDPESASRLRAPDTQRVLRAYEVVEATGRPLSEWQKGTSVALLEGLSLARFVLSPSRPELHRRIEARFDAMLDIGALDEAKQLQGIDPALPAAKILGLRDLNAVRMGAIGVEQARTAAITATRQYAKRQVTWLRHRMADWQWMERSSSHNFVTNVIPLIA
jgi:tRNA dimethylallyltransferase